MRNVPSLFALTAASAFALAGCSPSAVEQADSADTDLADAPGLSVVVSNTILGSVVQDIVRCATGDDSSVSVVMPIGADPHDFQPSSAQVAQMAAADLVVVNGLGLEEGLLPALESITADGASVLEVAAQLDPLTFGTETEAAKEDDHDHESEASDEHDHDHGADEHNDEESHEEEHDHDHAGGLDPHFWLDMDRMADGAELIGERLQQLAGGDYDACGEQTAEIIEVAEASVIDVLASVPEANRVLVTDHDALAYFALRYGYSVAGVVIPGGSTLGEPNSKELAALVEVIQDREVPAIFGNVALGEDIMDVLADEAGRNIEVVSLFIGSLGGPESGATTYIELMTTNANRIAEALTD